MKSLFLICLVSVLLTACGSNPVVVQAESAQESPTLSIQEILALDDPWECYIQMSNHLWIKSAYMESMDVLTAEEQVFLMVDYLQMEVNNGGLDQFFFNSSGDYAQNILEACETVGASQSAALLRQAMAEFPDGQVPADREARWKLMEELPESHSDAWSALDEEFWSDPDNIAHCLSDYAQAHQEQFS